MMLMFCLSTSVKSHVLYMRRPSWPTHNKMYVTRSACSLSRNGPLKISSQYCLNDLNSVGRSAANQFIRGGSIPDSSPMAIMGVFNNMFSQCVNAASLFQCYFNRKSTGDHNHNTKRRQAMQRMHRHSSLSSSSSSFLSFHQQSCPLNCALPMPGTADGDVVSRCQVLGRAGSVHHGADQ